MTAGFLLDAGTTLTCPHGGVITIVPSVQRVSLGGRPPLLAGDRLSIAGCSFNVGGSPSPCSRVAWTGAATHITVEGGAPLLSTSSGTCQNAAGGPQGLAIVGGFQTRVTTPVEET